MNVQTAYGCGVCVCARARACVCVCLCVYIYHCTDSSLSLSLSLSLCVCVCACVCVCVCVCVSSYTGIVCVCVCVSSYTQKISTSTCVCVRASVIRKFYRQRHGKRPRRHSTRAPSPLFFFFATGKDTEKAAQTLQTRALTVLDTQAQRAKTGKSKPRQI